MEQKSVYRGNDTLFYNSQCLFVEYHDVLSMPWFTMLLFTKDSKIFHELFNMDEIMDYDINALVEWYIYRKYRNVFKCLGINDETKNISDEIYDNLLDKAMNISDDIYRIPISLKFLSSLRLLMTDASLVKDVIIYSEKNEPMIEETLNVYFSKHGSKVKYMNGKFEDIIKSIPRDSTYVLSDIEKINTLIKMNKIELSTIMIANGLRYTYMENDSTKLKIDLSELSDKYAFKYSFFDNFDLTNVLGIDALPSEKIN